MKESKEWHTELFPKFDIKDYEFGWETKETYLSNKKISKKNFEEKFFECGLIYNSKSKR